MIKLLMALSLLLELLAFVILATTFYQLGKLQERLKAERKHHADLVEKSLPTDHDAH